MLTTLRSSLCYVARVNPRRSSGWHAQALHNDVKKFIEYGKKPFRNKLVIKKAWASNFPVVSFVEPYPPFICFETLNFETSNLFRISIFVLRISLNTVNVSWRLCLRNILFFICISCRGEALAKTGCFLIFNF